MDLNFSIPNSNMSRIW